MEWNEKQIRILEIAEKLFAENGFDGTSIRQISKEADINIAMISYYFGSKEKLLEALLLYRTGDFKMELESRVAKEQDFLKTVEDIVELVVKKIHRNRRTYKIIHFEYSNENRNIDFDSYIEQKKENYKLIQNFVERGQKAGVFAKNIRTELIIPTVLGTYFHFYYNKRFFQSLQYLNEPADIDQYVTEILTPHVQKTIKALLTYEV
ncbi:TetR family transcriptional regulator [Flavobacteriaceae bacterium F89]|uniref:TetR family transcriptional regulator n=1 Tax=Cerina litoralis TaxID=2874477 RepID=A0AAE3EYP7_9FLAO|nr:TetR family transcriptional regulator [Cerina litoralis]MCG2462157.1 TetR family transcriptional regulator [Cerina litoralis]